MCFWLWCVLMWCCGPQGQDGEYSDEEEQHPDGEEAAVAVRGGDGLRDPPAWLALALAAELRSHFQVTLTTRWTIG